MTRPLVCLAALALAAGCRVAPPPRAATHPASPAAPAGRLAGPPAVLASRPADLIVAPPAEDAPPAHHHDEPAADAPPAHDHGAAEDAAP